MTAAFGGRWKVEKMKQRNLACVLAMLASLALAGGIYLVFLFPKTFAVWKDEGRVLSVAEQAAVNLSLFCQSSGLVLFPLLLAGAVGCAIWTALAARRCG
jgi:hypothetical protein